MVGVVVELTIGFGSKPWWQALLLPIPPLLLAAYLFRRPSPVLPFFLGIAAVFLAIVLKIT